MHRFLVLDEISVSEQATPEKPTVQKGNKGSLSIATTLTAGKIMVKTIDGTEVAVSGPGYVTTDVVRDALEDILFYRREVARLSDGQEAFRPCFRAYKAYLASSITAVDATMNKLAFYALADKNRQFTEEERRMLTKRNLPIKKKILRWLRIISGGKSISSNSQLLKDFVQLRDARNSFTHVNSPTYKFSVEESAEILNLCRSGIGNLIAEIYKCLGRECPTSIISNVCDASLASYVPR